MAKRAACSSVSSARTSSGSPVRAELGSTITLPTLVSDLK